MSHEKKLEKYSKGEYLWPRPYPSTIRWQREDFIKYIDYHNLWIGD